MFDVLPVLRNKLRQRLERGGFECGGSCLSPTGTAVAAWNYRADNTVYSNRVQSNTFHVIVHPKTHSITNTLFPFFSQSLGVLGTVRNDSARLQNKNDEGKSRDEVKESKYKLFQVRTLSHST